MNHDDKMIGIIAAFVVFWYIIVAAAIVVGIVLAIENFG